MLSYTATPRLTIENGFFQAPFWGFCITTRLDLLAFIPSSSDPPQLHCYASTDNGETWSLRSELPSIVPGHFQSNPLNFPPDVVCILGADLLDKGFVVRSTDAGHTWSTAQTFDAYGQEVPPWFEPGKGSTFGRGKGIYTCRMPTFEWAEIYQLLKTTDAGASWTPSPMSYPTGCEPISIAATAAGTGNKFIAAGQRLYHPPDGLTDLEIAITTDGGSTWTWSANIERPDPGQNVFINDLTLLRQNHIIAVTGHGNDAGRVIPDIYNSTDSGASWTRVDPSDIAGESDSTTGASAGYIKRLTRDAALLGLQAWDNAGNFPFRISNDRGLTWNTIPSVVGASLPIEAAAHGFPLASRHSRIICAVTPGLNGFNSHTLYTLDPLC